MKRAVKGGAKIFPNNRVPSCAHHVRPFATYAQAAVSTTGIPTTSQSRDPISLKPFKSIPMPKSTLPLIGNTLELLREPEQMHSITNRYASEASIIRFKAGPIDLVLASDPDAVGHIFQSKSFVDRPNVEVLTYFRQEHDLGLGIAGSNGQDWERARGVANKTLLVPKIAQDFAVPIRENAESFVQQWKRKHKDGADVSIAGDIEAFTVDTIGKLAFGEDFRAMAGAQSELAQAISDTLRLFQELVFVPIPYYKYIQTPAVKRLHQALRIIGQLGGELVQKRRKQLAEGQHQEQGRTNFVTLLVGSRDDEGKELSTPDILGGAFDIIVAGQETTSRMISWTIHELSKNPELQERLYQEVRQHVKTPNDLTYDLVMGGAMPLLTNVIKEGLRMYPPAVLITREATVDESLGGYHIPAGTGVAIAPWALSRNPALWKEPEKYNPDRFNEDHHPYAWVPFGAGRRGCVGMRIALLEGKIFLARLVRSFQFGHNGKYRDPLPISKLSLGPDGPVVATLNHRD